jgi:tetratricopeptide (TPR) repeat protein
MAGTAELLATGLRYHQAGDLSRAAQVYQKVVKQEPGNAQAWYLLGALCGVQGKLPEAITHYQRALRLRPNWAEAQHGLGLAHLLRGQPAEAEGPLRRAVQLQPSFASAQNNLAIALLQQGKLEEALSHYRQSERLQPKSPDIQNNLGDLLRKLGRLDEAAASYRRALELRPGCAVAHQGLGCVLLDQGRHAEAAASCEQALRHRADFAEAYNTLGLALAWQGKTDAALVSYQRAVGLRPDYAEALMNLGHALGELGRLDEAVETLQKALGLCPGAAGALSNLGTVYLYQGKLERALACCREAVQLHPDNCSAHTSLGLVLSELGEQDEALASHEQALRLRPEDPHAHRNRSLVRLLQGDLERGWAEYEWRWRCGDLQLGYDPQRQWDGSPLEGRTLLLHAEQGLGDTLHFIRYAPLLAKRGARVLVVCQARLVRLLAGCPGIDQVLAHGDPLPPFDVYAPLLSVPRLCGTTWASIPADVPYLWADPGLVEQWRQELAARPGFKIGINWQGNPKFRLDKLRSIPLKAFAPLAEVPGVQLVSLQHGAAAELGVVASQWPVTDLGGHLDETTGAFMDTAAVMKNLDLVVTPDTVLGHLAGALGVPVWAALAKVPDWRWMLEREDTPWYPTMRLFRQEQRGEWESVFRRMAQAVEQRLRGPGA